MATTIADFRAAHLTHCAALQAVAQAEQTVGTLDVVMSAVSNARGVLQNAAAQRDAVFKQLPPLVQAALAAGTTAL